MREGRAHGSPRFATAAQTDFETTNREILMRLAFHQQNYDDSGNGVDRPPLRIGIVLPRQIFQRRHYQSAIWKSLNDISQMR